MNSGSLVFGGASRVRIELARRDMIDGSKDWFRS